MKPSEASASEKKHVSRAAGTVGFYTFLSRLLGLARDMVIARYFGSGTAADAFFVAFRIPNLLRRLFAEGSLTIAFIPVFGEYLVKKSREDAFLLARVILTLLSAVLALVTALGILLAPWVVRIQAFGFGGSGFKYDLTVLLTRITFPYIFLISLVALFMGMLNSLRHFAAPAAAPIFLNVGIIATTLWISPHLAEPIVAVAIGVILGGILQVALQIPWILKAGISLAPCWMPRHPGVKRIGLLMLPAIFGSAIYQFNQFIGTLLASFLPEGSISWLYYADRLVQFPLGVFAIAISTAALPSLSRQAAEEDLESFNDTLNHALKLVFLITVPSMVGLIILREPIIRILFERGAFDSVSTAMTARALLCYSLGLWAFSGIRVMVSAFYALQDTRTPVKVAALSLVVNLGMSLLLMGPFKHGGLALALSIASTVQFGLLILFLRNRLQTLDLKGILFSIGRCLGASLCMGAGIYYVQRKWWNPAGDTAFWGTLGLLAGLVLMGIGIYFVVMALLGSREITSLVGALKRRGKNGTA